MSLETQIANLVAATNQLTGEVSGKMAAINQTVDVKKAELDAWRNNARNEFSFPFKKTITVGGDANKFYPVLCPGFEERFIHDLQISRYFGDPAPASLGPNVAGLVLRMKLVGHGMSPIRVTSIEDHRFAYHWSVGRVQALSIGFVFWLRGGGMQYMVTSSGNVFDGDMYGTPVWTPQIADAVVLMPNAPDVFKREVTSLTEPDLMWQANITNRTFI